MRKTLILVAAASSLLATGTALAQAPEGGAMRHADVTREAAEQRANAMFARLDVNEDGQLNTADREARQQQRFDRIDANGDGAITPDELSAMREQRREHRAEHRAERHAARAEGGDHMARGEGRRGHGMRGRHHRRGGGMAMLAQADANSDGAVSQAEFTSAALARFDAADANGDGTLSREERRAHHRERRGEHRGEHRQQAG